MTDRIQELEAQVECLQAALETQTTAKDQAYEDLATQSRRIDELSGELADTNAMWAREAAHTSALGFEVTLYRDRYQQALARISAAGRAITIANAARDYLAAIERRGSLEDDVVVHLDRLREEVGFSLDADVNPLHVMIAERDTELETLRRRSAVLKDEIVGLSTQLEDAQGHAADWQELAEINDRKLFEAQQQLKVWELWPAEARHALGHVATCADGCTSCRHLATATLELGKRSPGGN